MATDYSSLLEDKLDDKELRVAAKLLLAIAEIAEEDDAKDELVTHFRELRDNLNHNIDGILKIFEGDTDATTKKGN